jgi:hypothetical protein
MSDTENTTQAQAVEVDISKLIIDDLPLLFEFEQLATMNLTGLDQARFLARCVPMIKRLGGDHLGKLPLNQLGEVMAGVLGAVNESADTKN